MVSFLATTTLTTFALEAPTKKGTSKLKGSAGDITFIQGMPERAPFMSLLFPPPQSGTYYLLAFCMFSNCWWARAGTNGWELIPSVSSCSQVLNYWATSTLYKWIKTNTATQCAIVGWENVKLTPSNFCSKASSGNTKKTSIFLVFEGWALH